MSWFKHLFGAQSARAGESSVAAAGRPARGGMFARLFTNTASTGASTFSLRELARGNPELAAQFLWSPNRAPALPPAPWLHWGCGDNVFDGWVNVDFFPRDERVTEWDFLDPWPLDALSGTFEGAFSEDTLEHFFLAEQAYILCNLNCVLKPGGVSRVLMPGYTRLVDVVREKDARPGGFLHDTFGAATETDAINMGLRFSGHRWLHDQTSIAHLAAGCGFDAVATSCAASSVPMLSNRNLRSESDSASFANDLVKRHALRRVVIEPGRVEGAELVERLENGAALYRAQHHEPLVRYALENPVTAESLACVNIRSANVTSFRSHYYKHIAFAQGAARRVWRLDETLKSKPCMNLMTGQQLRQTLSAGGMVDAVEFRPAERGLEYFTLGPLELFIR